MTILILSLTLVCFMVIAAVLSFKNKSIIIELNEHQSKIEELKKSLEMANAFRQLLRNEVKVLNDKITKLQQPPSVDVEKKKKPGLS